MLVEVIMMNASEVNSTTVAPTSKPDDEMVVTIRYVKFYVFSIILPLGLIANVLSLVVFGASHLKKTSTGHYLIALAVADTMYLSGEFFLWFSHYIENDFMIHGYVHQIDWICKSVYYLRYCGRLLSAWLTVVITIERFIAIGYPFHVSMFSTPNRAKVLLIVLCAICLGAGSFPLYTLNSVTFPDGNSWCIPFDRRELYSTMFRVVLTFGELVIPSAIVFIFTALILWKLSQSRRLRRESVTVSRGTASRRTQEAQITATLLAIAISFLILRLPQILFYYLNDLEQGTNLVYLRAYEISYTFFAINYCTNFVYYCAFGRAFRIEFLRLCCGKQPLKRRSSGGTMISRISKSIVAEPLKHSDKDTAI